MTGPVALIILDGFGVAEPSPHNAITKAEPRYYQDLVQTYPYTTLSASGGEVGLPCGLMGNSEVGHLNIGAGRIVWQDISRIDNAIEDGTFFENEALLGAVRLAVKNGTTLHLMGLVSDGGVHSSDRHLLALLDLAKREGLRNDAVALHAFLDGRDTPPRSAMGYLATVEDRMKELQVGRVATVCGRYYAMDRDKRWERVKKAYDALAFGEGETAATALAAVEAAYAREESDEFVLPTVIGSPSASRIRSGEACIFFNYRSDRARELTDAFLSDEFEGFERRDTPRPALATMTRYRQDFDCPVAFAPNYLKGILPEVVSKAGLSQLRIAETEKYAHVTFFMSGGDEREYPGEQRILVPSPKVATYDLAPAMAAEEVTDRLLETLESNPPDMTILNYANADMVGHTGDFDAAMQAVSTIDRCLQRVVGWYLENGGVAAVTADHGNCEMMMDEATGQAHTAHTTNPVPFVLAGNAVKGRSMQTNGRLCDIAPTLLPLLGLEQGDQMEGHNLL